MEIHAADNTQKIHPLDPARLGPEGLVGRMRSVLSDLSAAPEVAAAMVELRLALAEERRNPGTRAA